MERISKKKWQVRLAAFVIFALGFVAGSLTLNLYNAYSSQGTSESDQGPSIFRFKHIMERLELSQDQTSEVEKILDDAREELKEIRNQSEPKVKEVRKQTEDRLQGVLNSDQWQQFQQIKNEMRERGRDRHRRGRRGHKER